MFDENYAKALTELADIRAKLQTAEAHGEQYRKNRKSLQDLTGEECLDRARYAVKAWKEAAEQLAAATERAEKAEREREEMAKRNRELRQVVETQVSQIEAACKQAEAAEAERDEWRTKALDVEKHPVVVALVEERDALRAASETHAAEFAYAQKALDEIAEICGDIPPDPGHVVPAVRALVKQNAALRAALEERDAQIEHLFRHSGRDGSDCYDALEVSAAWMRLRSPIPALALTPPAALDDLRRRERSIGAEEELRRIAQNWHTDMVLWTAQNFIDRADALAAERDHIADAGKKVNHPGIPEGSGGAR